MYQTRIFQKEQKLEESDFGRYLYDCWEVEFCKDPERREMLLNRIFAYKERINKSVIRFYPDGSCNKP